MSSLCRDGAGRRRPGAAPGTVTVVDEAARKDVYRFEHGRSGGVVDSDGLVRQHEVAPGRELTRRAPLPPSAAVGTPAGR